MFVNMEEFVNRLDDGHTHESQQTTTHPFSEELTIYEVPRAFPP